MNDKELLELAAKAVEWRKSERPPRKVRVLIVEDEE